MAVDVKVNDVWWKRIMRFAELQSSKGRESHVKVGMIANSKGRELDEAGKITMVELAAIHEFGSPAAGVPERSFIRRTFKDYEAELATITTAIATQFVAGAFDLEKALNKIGAWGAGAIRRRVTKDMIPPPNAPSTVKAKGSSRPLVDTGRMLNAISWKVWMGRARGADGRFI